MNVDMHKHTVQPSEDLLADGNEHLRKWCTCDTHMNNMEQLVRSNVHISEIPGKCYPTHHVSLLNGDLAKWICVKLL